jgi:hypothetical protein
MSGVLVTVSRMLPQVWPAIISGVAGLLTGSAVTAWAKWPIEKRRLKLQRRYALLDSWRDGIAGTGAEFGVNPLNTSWYETLRPYLAEDVVRQLEKPRTVIVPSESGRGVKNLFTREVDRIEWEWGLRP